MRKTGVMIVGLSGNNGSSMLAANILAKHGKMDKMYGSLASVGTMAVNQEKAGMMPEYKSFREIVPSLLKADDVVIGGWDIRGMSMEEAMINAKVLDRETINEVKEEANKVKVLPSCYYPTYLAENQRAMATNCIKGEVVSSSHLCKIRDDISRFKQEK